ncbi:MAG: flagellin [Oxalobacteraceae bacterium]|nr:flagellin [Oxalobacteraceae bacterium]
MASYINTNLASLNAQRNLSTSQSSLATSLQRLSSGLRINSAKDDAAGLAISDRLTSQIRGSTQAARNANDAISLSQTAEGDLAQIGANLQRGRELAVQAANGSNSASDRASLNNELTQLTQEIDRVAQSSSFNGNSLLNGNFTGVAFQVGANNSTQDRITIGAIASARTTALGSSFSATATSAGAVNTAFSATDLVINGIAVGASTAAQDTVSSTGNAFSAIAKAAAINAASTGVTATVNANSKPGGTITGFASPANDIASGDLVINGLNIGAITAGGTNAATQAATVQAAINAKSAATGVTASLTGAALTLTAADGRNIDVTLGTSATAANTGLTAGTYSGTLTLTSTASTGFTIADGGSTTGAANLGISVGSKAASATGTAVSALNISTVAGAQTAIASLDSALATINSSRASLGAYQNRFASAITSLQTTTENLSASRSRIEDTDFAAETASLTRGQILQQAGTAILAQANSLPNGVLALLR